MTLDAGAKLGPYEIEAVLGAGGMGEVYRARDPRLDRTVAIKVLPQEVTDNPARRQRLEREARAISRLSHPRICALHDIGEQNGVQFLVMEYLEGETLADRLRRGPLPIREALRHAIEIADALDHAHRDGVVHRDLKPANIMLTRSGAMLLDFGLAKASAFPMGTKADVTLTEEGAIVGTVQYMAPEQLEGKDTDGRSDIFALGAVLYEILCGRVAFEGTSKASVIAAILERDLPPVSTARKEHESGAARTGELTPPLLDRVVAKCLAKHPDERWQTASDLRQALEWIAEDCSQAGVSMPARAPSWGRARVAWVAAGLVALLAGLAALVFMMTRSTPAPTDLREVRFDVFPPKDMAFGASAAFMAVSPDGNYLAFHVQTKDGQAMWLRSLDSLAAHALPGGERGVQPFWSPDSRFLAFIADGKLKKVEIAQGVSQTLGDADQQSGSWSRDGVILFKQRAAETLFRISSAGGPATPVTTLDRSRAETAHVWPQFLPDGRHFLYVAKSSRPEHDGVVYLGSLDSSATTRLFAADSHAAYASPGYLLFTRGGTLLALPFDADSLRVTGEEVPVAGQVIYNLASRRAAFSVSQNGVLAFRMVGETQRLVWVDRTGSTLQAIGQPGHFVNLSLAPDDARVAVARLDPETGAQNIWLIETAPGGNASQFTFDRTVDDNPLWAPDGSSVVFRSNQGGGGWRFYRKAINDESPVELLPTMFDANGMPLDMSRDGRVLVYHSGQSRTRRDIWTLPLVGDRKPSLFLGTEFNETQGRLSPNGRWIAYVSDESTRDEVYVRPFPSGDGKWRISQGGGAEPKWRSDGKELFYRTPDRTLMAVPIATDSAFEAGAPKALFEMPLGRQFPYPPINQFAVAADGQRFLVHQRVDQTSSTPIAVVLHWNAKLNR